MAHPPSNSPESVGPKREGGFERVDPVGNGFNDYVYPFFYPSFYLPWMWRILDAIAALGHLSSESFVIIQSSNNQTTKKTLNSRIYFMGILTCDFSLSSRIRHLEDQGELQNYCEHILVCEAYSRNAGILDVSTLLAVCVGYWCCRVKSLCEWKGFDVVGGTSI